MRLPPEKLQQNSFFFVFLNAVNGWESRRQSMCLVTLGRHEKRYSFWKNKAHAFVHVTNSQKVVTGSNYSLQCHFFLFEVVQISIFCDDYHWKAVTLHWRGGSCAHYVMVSKFQWKPLWLATQRDPQNDWTATPNRVNCDVFAQAPLVIIIPDSGRLCWAGLERLPPRRKTSVRLYWNKNIVIPGEAITHPGMISVGLKGKKNSQVNITSA